MHAHGLRGESNHVRLPGRLHGDGPLIGVLGHDHALGLHGNRLHLNALGVRLHLSTLGIRLHLGTRGKSMVAHLACGGLWGEHDDALRIVGLRGGTVLLVLPVDWRGCHARIGDDGLLWISHLRGINA
jgi:hypothetical protein